MKLHLLLLLALGLLVPVAARAESYSFREPFAQSSAFKAAGVVTLENINGDVVIHTWDKNEIRIEGEKSAATDDELKLIDLQMDLSESAARIKVHLPKRKGAWFGNNIRASVRFDITVPASAQLEHVRCVNSTIKIDDVRGSVDAESVNGAVRAHGLGGDARLGTVNGTVDAQFDRVAGEQHLDFRTVNGGVNVRLPKDAGVTIHCSVVNGHVDCDLPVQGMHRRGRSLSGAIGDGRASLKAEAVNGGIHIRST